MEKIINSFNEKVINEEGLCIVDFFANWCGPCKMFEPIFEETEKEFKKIKFYKFNVDENNTKISKSLGIMTIPTIILFNNGKEVKRNVGFLNKEEFKKFLDI